jgi:hypothetical protein
MSDAFVGSFFAAVVFSTLAIILVSFFKPDKRTAASCLVGGVVFAVTGFLTEALAADMNLWHYFGSLVLLGVPITQPFHFLASGFGFSLIYKEGALKFRVPAKYYKTIVLPIYLLVVLTICVSFDLWGAAYQFWVFSPGWTPLNVALVWLMLWLVCLAFSSERFLAGTLGTTQRFRVPAHHSATSV